VLSVPQVLALVLDDLNDGAIKLAVINSIDLSLLFCCLLLAACCCFKAFNDAQKRDEINDFART